MEYSVESIFPVNANDLHNITQRKTEPKIFLTEMAERKSCFPRTGPSRASKENSRGPRGLHLYSSLTFFLLNSVEMVRPVIQSDSMKHDLLSEVLFPAFTSHCPSVNDEVTYSRSSWFSEASKRWAACLREYGGGGGGGVGMFGERSPFYTHCPPARLFIWNCKSFPL